VIIDRYCQISVLTSFQKSNGFTDSIIPPAHLACNAYSAMLANCGSAAGNGVYGNGVYLDK